LPADEGDEAPTLGEQRSQQRIRHRAIVTRRSPASPTVRFARKQRLRRHGANFPDGRGGSQLAHLQSGTKSTTDGASMTIDVHFATDAPSNCAIHVQGTASKW
jgi:hypothetical protein